ncbi:MAG: YggS family pyridoxal phosphate-dependent enzyme [Planctomycetota bacterium]
MIKMVGAIPIASLKRNLMQVRERIAAAAARVSRLPDTVKLVAIAKSVGVAEIKALMELGVTEIGESRAQDAKKKIMALGAAAGAHWHLVGHLQTNKADQAASLFQTIHSVDSIRVAQALHKEMRKLADQTKMSQPLRCLLEINVAGESSKFGLPPTVTEIAEILRVTNDLSALRIVGLMTMAPYVENDATVSRPIFQKLRELRDELNDQRCYSHPLIELSMGMSQDYWIAVEEGATLVRIGSALFEI